MAKTVVSLFRSMSEAQNAKHELINEGYSAKDIQVFANEEQSVTTHATVSSSAESGIGAKISNFFRSLTGGEEEQQQYEEGLRNGGAVLSVMVSDGEEAGVVQFLKSSGGQDVESENAGVASGSAVGTLPSKTNERAGTTAVPIVEEALVVGKRQVQVGGVRVYSHLVETPVSESVQLREEHVRIDRQSVNRPATETDFTSFQEGTIELTETAEEAVVSKNARVVEEISLGKEATERTETVQDTVRHTEVEIEQLGTTQTAASSAVVTPPTLKNR